MNSINRYLFYQLLVIGMSFILVQCKLFQSDQQTTKQEASSGSDTTYVEVE